ncbi:UDP-glycosyltransferase UGT5-like [Culicoides brevitarsis]|uniref:UDP-glycosyltransferase UGT5-like n=1 Tax=Culicoides brevitarsis TaxID=469753 RepID=UPI00307B1A86
MKLLLFFVCCLWTTANCANILAVFPTQARSHYIVSQRLLFELAKSGHQVTVITLVQTKNLPEGYNEIYLDFGDEMDEIAKGLFNKTDENQLASGSITGFFLKMVDTSRRILLHEKVQSLMKSNAKFDLFVFEIFMDEALLGLAHHFKIPAVGISTIGVSRWVEEFTATPMPYSYIPHALLNFQEQMTFSERFINTIASLFEEGLLRFLLYPKMEEIYNEVFPDPKPDFYTLRKTAISLTLLNSHISLGGTKPMMSNMIEVGGMHVELKTKPLPKDMQDFIDSAEHGVIYFCLGSNVRPKYMHAEKKQAILRAFSKMKEKVIWKFDDDTLEYDKNKIYIAKWMPQNDILANPKVKVFITHGGLLGTTEAIVHGVPLVGIPIMADQNMNMAKAELAGYGIKLQYTNLTEVSLKWALDEVINNPKYRNTVKEMSARFRDRPQDPLETAKYWIEYVIRHKGAHYLKSPALKLNTVERYNMDVYAIFLILGQLVLFISYKILSFAYYLIFGGKKNNSKSKKE